MCVLKQTLHEQALKVIKTIATPEHCDYLEEVYPPIGTPPTQYTPKCLYSLHVISHWLIHITEHTWLDTDEPNLKLFTSWQRYGCKNDTTLFSVPQSALNSLGAPKTQYYHCMHTFSASIHLESVQQLLGNKKQLL